MRYASMAAIRKANADAGHHWFEPDTMRFFRTRVHGGPYGGRYFVTSEQADDESPRMFSVRAAFDDGGIGTVGMFQQYATREAAEAEARAFASMLEGDAEPCLRWFAEVDPGTPKRGIGHHFAYSGRIPNTGPRLCTLCNRREV